MTITEAQQSLLDSVRQFGAVGQTHGPANEPALALRIQKQPPQEWKAPATWEGSHVDTVFVGEAEAWRSSDRPS
jgi:acetylornithine deacetylase/succinyl-diaminopimelate desuccinylase-like protein